MSKKKTDKECFSIDSVVKNDLCTGCGICISESRSSAMVWNQYGFLVPKLDGSFNESAIKMCPFNPHPDKDIQNETKLASIFLKDSKKNDNKVGRYENIYIGYSNDYRETSSSGGIATYVFEQLLRQGIVKHLFIVKEVNGTYEYQWFSDVEQIIAISKTRYIPVTLENLFKEIDSKQGLIAVSGVACFVKALRLKQYYCPQYKEKIPFVIGIICGGLKSKFFTDYLAQKSGIEGKYFKQEYRIKDVTSEASDYSFGAFDDRREFHQIKMSVLGDMWGTGMFKANACDFCDDVTTELADISLGDAWLKPYCTDGKGTSVIITRSMIAENIINGGIRDKKINVELLSVQQLKMSQQGSFNHRHTGLSIRLKAMKRKSKLVLSKRFENEYSTYDFKIVQLVRMKTRQISLDIWKRTKNPLTFEQKIKWYLSLLKITTRIYHYKKKLLSKFNIK